MEIKNIIEIREGRGILKNPICKVFSKGYSARINKIIAIVSKERILELEAPTLEAKNLWMGYFKNLLANRLV